MVTRPGTNQARRIEQLRRYAQRRKRYVTPPTSASTLHFKKSRDSTKIPKTT